MTIGKRLKAQLALNGMTQFELASKISGRAATISAIVNDVSEPTLSTLRSIKTVLDCSWDDLLG